MQEEAEKMEGVRLQHMEDLTDCKMIYNRTHTHTHTHTHTSHIYLSVLMTHQNRQISFVSVFTCVSNELTWIPLAGWGWTRMLTVHRAIRPPSPSSIHLPIHSSLLSSLPLCKSCIYVRHTNTKSQMEWSGSTLWPLLREDFKWQHRSLGINGVSFRDRREDLCWWK